MRNIALILNSDQPRSGVFADYPHGNSLGIPMYALASTELSAFCCIVITNYADQRELLRCRVQLQRYLQQGGKLVFNGHVVYPSWMSCSPTKLRTKLAWRDCRYTTLMLTRSSPTSKTVS